MFLGSVRWFHRWGGFCAPKRRRRRLPQHSTSLPGLYGNGPAEAGIFYNPGTGEIAYNPTTGVPGDAVLFALVDPGTVLSNTDFVLI